MNRPRGYPNRASKTYWKVYGRAPKLALAPSGCAITEPWPIAVLSSNYGSSKTKPARTSTGPLSTRRIEEIRTESPDHLEGWGRLATLFFRLYFLIVRW